MSTNDASLYRPAFVAAAFALLSAAPGAHATAQRTFVATDGADANPCSLIAPCRSFGAALAQTTSGGEIVVLSSGGYGPVVVDRSVAIIAPAGVHAGITVFTGAGITIATPGITVKLRGLTVGGQGGSNGVNYTAGERLIVEDCTFSNLLNDGIRIEGEGLRGSISNSRFENITESGIHARNGAQISVDRGAFVGGNSGVSAYSDTGNVPSIVLVSDSHFEGMAGAIGGGVQLSGSAEVVATRNTILGRTAPWASGGIHGSAYGIGPPPGAAIRVIAIENTITRTSWGISGDASMVLSGNSVTHSGKGIWTGGDVRTLQNNVLEFNTINVEGTLTPATTY